MQDDVAYSQALEKIYAATLSESSWPDALRTVSGLFDSEFAHFEVLEKKPGAPCSSAMSGRAQNRWTSTSRIMPKLRRAPPTARTNPKVLSASIIRCRAKPRSNATNSTPTS